jgi:hypothetical protein
MPLYIKPTLAGEISSYIVLAILYIETSAHVIQNYILKYVIDYRLIGLSKIRLMLYMYYHSYTNRLLRLSY